MSKVNNSLVVVTSFTAFLHSTTAVLSHNTLAPDDFFDLGESRSAHVTQKSMALEESFVEVNSYTSKDLSASMIAFDEKRPVSTNKVVPLAPLVKQDGDKVTLNSTFVENVLNYAEMTELTYHIVRGRVEPSTQKLEEYTQAGWKITFFGGFSGNGKFDKEQYDAKNRDVAGFVAFHPQTCEAVVCFHGSQDGLDWENNFDGQMVETRELGLKFHGKVHYGFGSRYASSKDDIHALLKRIYQGLDQESKDKFHITTTGHSLGGGMTTIAFADLATDFAKDIWGKDYNNATNNRIRAIAFSPPRAFDTVAVDELKTFAGEQNIIIDTNDMDPVSMFGPGKTLTKWVETSSAYGPVAALLSAGKKIGLVKVSNPQAAAQLYGGSAHLGYKAYQNTNDIIAKAKKLPVDPRVAEVYREKNILQSFVSSVKATFAPYHYGTDQVYGASFDSRLIEPETLETRINKTHSTAPVAEAPATKPWYKFW